MQLILSLAVLAHLASCLEVSKGHKGKTALDHSDNEGEGRRPSRHHSDDRNHSRHGSHHHHRHHSRHHSHDHDHDHGHCPPCDLSVCTSKFGNFTVMTRPVTWEQARNACAMIGLRLARINIENFMDATKAAFQCSGPFSQSWVQSWNGDAYGGKGLVLSTGNAAPGGAINEVVDPNSGRNVVCEVSDTPVPRPDCHHGDGGCGCNRPGAPCGCGGNPMPRPEPVLHGKMKCLRCFCRRNAECPLQDGPSGSPIAPIAPSPTGNGPQTSTRPNFVGPQTSAGPNIPEPSSTGGRPTSTRGRPTSLPTPPAKVQEKEVGSVEKALKAVGRFIQIPSQEKIAKKTHDDEDGGDDQEGGDNQDGNGDNQDNNGDDQENNDDEDSNNDDDEDDQEDFEVEQVVFDNDAKSLEKGFPFNPETCGAQCVCYACKDYEPERHHHRRCRRRNSSHHHHHHRVYERPQPIDDLKKAALQLQSLRQIVAWDETGKQIQQEAHIDADQDMKIQVI